MPVHRLRPATKPSLGLLGRFAATQTGLNSTAVAVNVALASAGGTITASSSHNSGLYPAANAFDGDRTGANYWNDNTPDVYVDVLERVFAQAYTISRVDVFCVQTNFASPINPTPTLTSVYALSNFKVQTKGSDGAWSDIPGAAVTGNTLVWVPFTFTPVLSYGVRIIITSALQTWSRVAQLEAWTSGSFNAPPVVAITSSFAGGIKLGADAQITITASDDSAVTAVSVYDNGNLLGSAALISGTAANGVWRYTHSNPAVGSHSYTAKATDSGGSITTSAAVPLSVTQDTAVVVGDRTQISSWPNDAPTATYADSSLQIPWVNNFGDYLDADLALNGSNHWASYTWAGNVNVAMTIPAGLINKLLEENTGIYLSCNMQAIIHSSRFGAGPPTLLVVMDDASTIACPVAQNVNNLGGNCDLYLRSALGDDGMSVVNGFLKTPALIRFDLTAVEAAIASGLAVDTGHQLLFVVHDALSLTPIWKADYLYPPIIPWNPLTIGSAVAGKRDSMSESAFAADSDTIYHGALTRAGYIADYAEGAFDVGALEPIGMREFKTWAEFNNLPAMRCSGSGPLTGITILRAHHDVAEQTDFWFSWAGKYRKNIQDGLTCTLGCKLPGVWGHESLGNGVQILAHHTRQSRTNPGYLGYGSHIYDDTHSFLVFGTAVGDVFGWLKLADSEGLAYTHAIRVLLNTFTGSTPNSDGTIEYWLGLPDTGGLVKIYEYPNRIIRGFNSAPFPGDGNNMFAGMTRIPYLHIFQGGAEDGGPIVQTDYEVAAPTLTRTNPGSLKRGTPTWRAGAPVGVWAAISGTDFSSAIADIQRAYSGTANDDSPTTAQVIAVGIGGHAEGGASDSNTVARCDLMQNSPSVVIDIAATSAPGTQFNHAPPFGYYLDGPGSTQGSPIAAHGYNEQWFIGTLPDGTVKNIAIRLRTLAGAAGSGTGGSVGDANNTYEANAVDYTTVPPTWRAAHSMQVEPAHPFGLVNGLASKEAYMACQHPITKDIYLWVDRVCWIWRAATEAWDFWFVPPVANGFVGSFIDVANNRYVSGLDVQASGVTIKTVNLQTGAYAAVSITGVSSLVATHQGLTMSSLVHDRKNNKAYWFCRSNLGDGHVPTMVKIDLATNVGSFIDTTGVPEAGAGPCNRVWWSQALETIIYMGATGPLWHYPTGAL
jgi:hypothetical protein